MSLRLQVDPGGEKYLSFARNKLDQMKAFMRQSGLKVQSKHFFISTAEHIWVKSLHVGFDTFLDWIRITAGGVWQFYYLAVVGSVVDFFVGEVDRATATVGTTDATPRVTGSLNAPFGIFKLGTQWKVADPARKVARVRDGELDTFSLATLTSSNTPFTVNRSEWGAVFVSGSDARLVSAAASVSMPNYSGYTIKRLLSTDDDFYFLGVNGGTGAADVYRLSTQAVALSLTETPAAVAAMFRLTATTLHDCLTATYTEDAGLGHIDEIKIYSARFGLLTTITHTPPHAGSSSGTGPTVYQAAATGNDYYLFALMSNTIVPAVFPDTSDNVFSVTKCAAQFDDAGLITGYAVTTTEVTIRAVAFDPEYFGDGAVATRDNAHLFLKFKTEVGGEDNLYVVDGAASALAFPLVTDSSLMGRHEIIVTPSVAWLTFVKPSDFGASPQTIKMYASDGGVSETAAVVSATYPATSLADAGHTNSVAYVSVNGIGAQRLLIGTDGSVLDMAAALPAFSASGAVTAFHTTAGIIYGFASGVLDGAYVVYHVTQSGVTRAYPVAASVSSVGAVAVPARSDIITAQEFAAWA